MNHFFPVSFFNLARGLFGRLSMPELMDFVKLFLGSRSNKEICLDFPKTISENDKSELNGEIRASFHRFWSEEFVSYNLAVIYHALATSKDSYQQFKIFVIKTNFVSSIQILWLTTYMVWTWLIHTESLATHGVAS